MRIDRQAELPGPRRPCLLTSSLEAKGETLAGAVVGFCKRWDQTPILAWEQVLTRQVAPGRCRDWSYIPDQIHLHLLPCPAPSTLCDFGQSQEQVTVRAITMATGTESCLPQSPSHMPRVGVLG